jgi:hypothetical protein
MEDENSRRACLDLITAVMNSDPPGEKRHVGVFLVVWPEGKNSADLRYMGDIHIEQAAHAVAAGVARHKAMTDTQGSA